MRLTLLILLLVAAYVVGDKDGRVSECRRSFNTVDGAITVWDECEQRIGLSTSQALYRLTHLSDTHAQHSRRLASSGGVNQIVTGEE